MINVALRIAVMEDGQENCRHERIPMKTATNATQKTLVLRGGAGS